MHLVFWQVNVFKEPITDMGKKSKKGRLTLEHENGEWVTKQEGTGNPDKVKTPYHSSKSLHIFLVG